MPARQPPKTDDESDESDDDGFDDEVDDDIDTAELEDDEDEDDLDDGEEEEEEDGEDDAPARRPRARREPQTRARGAGGMGRPSTGPAIRRSAAVESSPAMTEAAEPTTEMAPDISTWPGTAEAARIVGRHTSTVKAWRSQGRVRALQDGSGCWRYHPDDLAEAIDTPDGTDPGSILAQGMTAIVSQGASANERLLAMTELATDGLKDAASVLSGELRRAYGKIADLEKELAELRRQQATERGEELKHERYIRRLDHKHELELAGSRETSARLAGLLTILGPIAASIGQRLVGDISGAERAESTASGVRPSPGPTASPSPPAPTPEASHDMPLETRIAETMARLCEVIRRLDAPAFAGLRAMMPPKVAEALDDIQKAESDGTVGRALAIIVQAAQGLSDLQFRALRPIAPADIAAILGELRELLKDVRVQPESPPS